MSVKANSFQEMCVLKLDVVLSVVTEFQCYPLSLFLISPCSLASHVIVSFHLDKSFSSRTARCRSDFCMVMIWQMPRSNTRT